MFRRPATIRRVASLLSLAGVLAGCQGVGEQLRAQGYPPLYADGFQAGCRSGHQADAGLGRFEKDVPRYMAEPLYAQGWDDGYRQCLTMAAARGGEPTGPEEDWRTRQRREHQLDQERARALAGYRRD